MKKIILSSLAVVLMLSSCATICGGKISDCQKTKPTDGTHRALRWWVCIPVIPFNWGPVGVIVDLADGAAYRPCVKK